MTDQDWKEAWTFQRDRAEAAEARVRELEQVPRNMRLVTEWELIAMEAATIERCAQVSERECRSIGTGIAAAIRALKEGDGG